ncbi:ImmA/IrrE family metallo-endopeptidase [Jiangella alkaliphila]|uniref:Zn-dependent peptidase ImmA, M78 family n=1 Tax=Jiangella alkaliphila TaxID=419479 RepID=A0A1H2K8P5_9ACTN|nr:ImmA/IrrE family metallo-endopeptidase [Jiangella alkaliphila]SDU65039.1 Zn-dependent peptidase ImmA, M78 family [Jiangella alkaliphila]
MPIRVDVAPSVLSWALNVTGADEEGLHRRFKVDQWLTAETRPTLKQLQDFARATGVPFGYLLLPQPPTWTLPVPDFREGFDGAPPPSANLIAVLGQSQRRQEWYRDYALGLGAEPLEFVGSAADEGPTEAAAHIRSALDFEISTRHGTWADTRKALLRSFEALGGLTIATSMVNNNTRRPLDENEFRGFALVDDIAPLVFVNTHQTINGQIFTLAHEFAHIWRGTSGIGNEDLRSDAQSEIERWCNAVASEVLVPQEDLESHHARVASAPLTEALDALAHDFRCGTLVVLQALHRTGLRRMDNYANAYDAEVARLRALSAANERGGGDHYNNQPFRVGERLSRALIADALEGRTSIEEAMRLMSMKSLSTFDEYARRLGAA